MQGRIRHSDAIQSWQTDLWKESDTFQPLSLEYRHYCLYHGVVMATQSLVFQYH